MNRVYGIVRTHLTDRWGWIYLPWIILGCSFVTNLAIGSLIDEEMYTGGLASIYVYLFVLGIMIVSQTFPFLVSFSVRRKDYFLGTTATIGIISIVSAVILILLGVIEDQTDSWGMSLYFFNVKFLSDGPIWEQLWTHFNLMLNLFFMGFIIACIYRKFGRNGMFFFFIALALVATVGLYLFSIYGEWKALFDWFADLTLMKLSLGLLVSTLVYVGVSYLLLRKATV